MAAGKRHYLNYLVMILAIALVHANSACSTLGIGGGESPEEKQAERLDLAIETRDIIMGMEPGQVVQAWGQPRDVEYAGSPGTGNERWFYYSGLSQRYQLDRIRVVYFESGKVAGWETR